MGERPRTFVGPVIGAVHGASPSTSFGPLSDFSADTYLVFTSQADTTACTRGSCLSGFDIWTAVDGEPASVVRAATHSQTFVVVDPAAGRAGPVLGANCRAFNAGPLPVIVGSLDVEPSTAGSDTLDYWNVGAFTATDTYSCGKAARSNAVTSQNNACIFVPSWLDLVCSMGANLGWVLWSRDNAAPEVDAGTGTYGGFQIGNGDTVAIKCTDAATFRRFEATTAAFNTSIGFRIAVRHFNHRQHRREGQCGCSRLRRYHPRRHDPQRPLGGRHGRTTELRRLRNASMIHRLIFLLLALAAPAFGTTYYVDPSTGSNASSGTSMAAPWKTPPGTRNAADTAYLNTAWGAITTSNKLQCGDTILLKGGQTYSATRGGSWCITSGGGCASTGSYYTATCTGANPITIRVATNAEWPGSTGSFVIDGSAIDPADSASFNYSGIISISHVSGIILKGAGPNQRLIVNNSLGDSSGNVPVGINMDGNISGITVQYVDVYFQYVGIAMGDISDSLVSDSVLHDNGGPAINCGDQVHHNCHRVGWVNIEAYGNAQAPSTLFYCDAFYIQGAQQLYVIGAYIHDNGCSGLNIGAGDHSYPYVARTLVRDAIFSHNGVYSDPNSARTNFQGGGDTYPSEVGAPGTGYCAGGPADGTVCANAGVCQGFNCSIYDSYATFERIVSFGAMGPGAYVPHGSGFSWMNRMTLYNNDLATLPGSGQFLDDSVAADHVLTNSILVNRAGTPLLSWNTNGLHRVCRQNCPKAGIPCSVDSDCGACAGGSVAACYQYRPMMRAKYNLFRPSFSGSNSEGMTTYGHICDASCTGGTAGQYCSSDAQCAGCAAGCVWAGGGISFAGAASVSSFFLSDTSNKIGLAYDPLFANVTATNCANGTDALACDFDLQPGSPAIDAGTFLMLTNGSGSNSTSLTVKENVKSPGTLDFNGKNGDPATFFIPQNGYPGYAGDTIQIQGATCPTGNPVVVSMSGSTITLDRSCSWSDGMGVDLPWNGSAPDMGAFESEAATSTLPATTTTTRTAPPTLPTTTSTSSMSSTTSTSLATSSTTTTTTTTAVTSSTTLLRGNGHGHRHRSGGG